MMVPDFFFSYTEFIILLNLDESISRNLLLSEITKLQDRWSASSIRFNCVLISKVYPLILCIIVNRFGRMIQFLEERPHGGII